MTATGHALIGALIAAKFHNPYLALPLSFASHFVCDVIPHWDTGTHRREKTRARLFYESAFDVAVSIISSFFLYHTLLSHNNYVFLYSCVFVSQLPDWLTAPYLMLDPHSTLARCTKGFYKIQHKLNSRLDKPWGIVTQILTVTGTYILLFKILP